MILPRLVKASAWQPASGAKGSSASGEQWFPEAGETPEHVRGCTCSRPTVLSRVKNQPILS